MSPSEERAARLRIWRGTEREAGHLEEYEVPNGQGASVLDALLWIRTHIDPSLAVRYSCTNANVCKECTVLIDGRVAFACATRVGTEPITVAPLPGKRLIRDLVTDIVPPLERLTNLCLGK